jgi:hypothetical protein
MAELSCGSAALEDDAFVTEFESCRFPNAQFRHADHIRLAWIYLRRYDYQAAEDKMRRSIQGFARHLGAEQKFHETITVFWMRLVNAALQLTSNFANFPDFASAHAWLLNKELIFEFYSRELVLSDIARCGWVEPDIKPAPRESDAASCACVGSPGRDHKFDDNLRKSLPVSSDWR